MDSYFTNIEHQIIKQIRSANNRILVAVAWFTNLRIGEEILKKPSLDIEIVVDDNEINRKRGNITSLQLKKVDITFIKELERKYYLMHNKFCVIDNQIVITGSYNWTQNANTNDENITVFSDSVAAAHYTHEFRRIKSIMFPNDNIFISDEDFDQITNNIYYNLLDLLKINIAKPERGLFFNWNSINIKNKIRTIQEGVRNNLLNKVGTYSIYGQLITKYGMEFNNKASDEEKIEARDAFYKQGLEEIDEDINKQFQFFKIRAIKKLQDNYTEFLGKNEQNIDVSLKILNVFQFITREKIDIAKSIGIRSI